MNNGSIPKERIPWTLPIDQNRLYIALEKRVCRPYKIPLKEIFLIFPAARNKSTGGWEEFECEYTLLPDERFGELSKQLPYDMKVFFVKESTGTKLLWTKKFNYPKISSPKTAKSLIIPPMGGLIQ